ncbi:tubulin folding cofactor D C terminal-domain-containing protein [Xylaria sp. CBS 124048]|nr:tubulin folding cofactor D C terminal-domain-containing protein [Xylaria sp. CBS 124048]
MDALDGERDVFIHKHAADFIADFDRSLGPFLRKSNGQLRRRVRTRETTRLISQVLEHFQELPQLLDPHLPRWLPVLAGAYLECLQNRRKSNKLSTRSQLLYSLPNAVCRILYTFCKIRGEKVIVRFLNVETKYLELLLQAIEDSAREADTAQNGELVEPWTWHERYIVLIWLSQLFFAPFDLSTISTGDADEFEQPVLPGLEWPQHVPRITLRVIPLATRYLASPGKERDGAKSLLVRLAMRKDMQEMGVLSALVRWALFTLEPKENETAVSPYYFIGSLSLLAGILRAAEATSIMDQHLSDIFYAVQAIPTEENDACKLINGSALARKMMIKVTRSVITIILRKARQSMSDTEIIETTIGYLLECLADNDTPVRFAASKALSIITLKLDPDMASQVIEAVIESLNRNVLWVKDKSDPMAPPVRDLTAVNPSEWHGLMLTLSHLLYRRSPPPETLSDIIHTLIIGLSFEKRTSSGSPTGTNVRDASCFGIWALARRYSTAELLRVETRSVQVARGHDSAASIIQVLATELVVTASLDPAGNIRRGSSAALQELIGRHPDTVEKGISVVQIVDYHAVALRSRAIHDVALQTTRLSAFYGAALLEATLGWRGIGDIDAGARRVAAASFGTLTAELARATSSNPLNDFRTSIELLLARVQALQNRQVEERHGLLLSLAAVLDFIPSFIREGTLSEQIKSLPVSKLCNSLKTILQESKEKSFRKPELIAEANSTLIVAAMPILLLGLSEYEQQCPQLKTLIQKGSSIVGEADPSLLTESLAFLDAVRTHQPNLNDDLLGVARGCVDDWLDRNETDVTKIASEAALVLLLLSKPIDRATIIDDWCEKVSTPRTPRKRYGDGYFHALARSYPVLTYLGSKANGDITRISIPKVLAERWAKYNDIETRVAIIQSLTDRNILRREAADLVGLISEGLDDYTTNARGDVGSHVRLEAIRATKTLWQDLGVSREIVTRLYPQILRLAAEKLDRVRGEAKSALAVILQPTDEAAFNNLSFASKEYFGFLFTLCDMTRAGIGASDSTPDRGTCTSGLLAGLVTSADTGNEDLVAETRAALAEICEASDGNSWQVCSSLLHNLKQYAGQDRVQVPTLEVIAYLFHVGLLQRCCHAPGAGLAHANEGSPFQLDIKQLCLLVQKAAYKSGNVRKLEACIKVYGALADVETRTTTTAGTTGGKGGKGGSTDVNADETLELSLVRNRQEGVAEARKRLGGLLLHPWPRVRSLVIDELWNLLASGGWGYDAEDEDHKTEAGKEGEQAEMEMKMKMLLGVDWGRAGKAHVETVVKELGLK